MLSTEDRKLYFEMYGFYYDELARAPAYNRGDCACQETKVSGEPCGNVPTQHVGSLLVCDYHIGWAKGALKALRRNY